MWLKKESTLPFIAISSLSSIIISFVELVFETTHGVLPSTKFSISFGNSSRCKHSILKGLTTDFAVELTKVERLAAFC